MKDITIIIPVLNAQLVSNDIVRVVNNVKECQKYYNDGELKVLIVADKIEKPFDDVGFDDIKYKYIINDSGKYDYCSQINFGVKSVDTEFFSILEYDDYYTKKWFNMFNTYYATNENVSVFLPINVIHNANTNEYEFVNDIVWSNSFANELGFIDFDCLQASASFNLTGGIFKTSDWLGYKPSILAAFNYEYLLRATNKGQKIFVVPKEGYHHEIFRENSLSDYYYNNISEDDNVKWFELAKREYAFDEDRNKGIINIKEDELQ